MPLPNSLDTPRCRLNRATRSDITAITQVFQDNWPLLESTGAALPPSELAEDAVFNKTLPPNGDPSRAFTYAITTTADDQLAGLVECYAGYPDETCLWTAKLFLRSSAQDMGYGREIMHEVEAAAKRSGMVEARTAINIPNWGALWFWSRIGYTRICGIHGPASPPDGMLALAKTLNPRL